MSERLRRLALAAALLSGCGRPADDGSTLRLGIELEPGTPNPEYLLVSWAGDGEVHGKDRRIPASGTLPGRGLHLGEVEIRLAAPGSASRTVVVRGFARGEVVVEGAGRVVIGGGASGALSVRLSSGALPDGDADGVPDLVDNCPEIANPGQGRCGLPGEDAPPAEPDLGPRGNGPRAERDGGAKGDKGDKLKKDAGEGKGSHGGGTAGDERPDGGKPGAGKPGEGGPGDDRPDAEGPDDGGRPDGGTGPEAIRGGRPDAGEGSDAPPAPPPKQPRGKACAVHGDCETGTCADSRVGRFCATAGMLVVPAGPFNRGCAPGHDPGCRRDERPAKVVTLKGFEIDRTEVTQGAYDACVKGGACVAPTAAWDPAGHPTRPVVAASWAMAQAYCKWAGKRLPTEAEWEKAARGPADEWRVYPWGNEAPGCDRAQFSGCGLAGVVPVGSLSGASPYGVEDAAGNASEWVSDFYDAEYYGRAPDADPTGPATGTVHVRRGGSFTADPAGLRLASRTAGESQTPTSVGFRCARDL